MNRCGIVMTGPRRLVTPALENLARQVGAPPERAVRARLHGALASRTQRPS